MSNICTSTDQLIVKTPLLLADLIQQQPANIQAMLCLLQQTRLVLLRQRDGQLSFLLESDILFSQGFQGLDHQCGDRREPVDISICTNPQPFPQLQHPAAESLPLFQRCL